MPVEKKKFQTEVSQLLQLVIHSLYSNKEIFLRELISNASDAIDKAKYEGITNPELLEGNSDWSIRLIPDEKNGTLTIRDNGIGMNKDEIVKSLGTIAHSGTKEFLKQVEKSGKLDELNNLIGQFGVGFYSAFMVADLVSVISRRRGDKAEDGVKWESDAGNSYTLETYTKDTPGTDVILKLNKDELKYLNEYTLRNIVSTYSDFIEYPVKMNVEKPVYDEEGKITGEKEVSEETLNSMKAVWLKDKTEVSTEELNQFYKHISKDFNDPLKTIQIKAEGTSEFYALLYIPKHQPFNMFHQDLKYGPMLYVKRVQIMEHCEELIPQYLRFIAGVVDSSDLPLNVSREILQNNRQITVIRKNIVKKVLDTLSDMKHGDYEQYKEFFSEFGKVLKEGIHTDFDKKADIAALCLFESTATKDGDYTTFDDYISRMKPEQKEIFYITGSSRKELDNSPYIEGLKANGTEVIFMTGEFDDIIFSGLHEYKEKHLKSVLKGELEEDGKIPEEKLKEFEVFLKNVKEALENRVAEVKLSSRLKESPVCLVTGEGAPDPQMERLLRAMGQPVPEAKRTLEINPDSELIGIMKDMNMERLKKFATILYDNAILLEGGKIDDLAGYCSLINEMMLERAKNK